jgi:hypothetical protein
MKQKPLTLYNSVEKNSKLLRYKTTVFPKSTFCLQDKIEEKYSCLKTGVQRNQEFQMLPVKPTQTSSHTKLELLTLYIDKVTL